MKFFVDTADIDEIRALAATGMVDGVTTNPSLIMKSGRDIIEVTKEICDLVPGPVSAEVAATEYDAMVAEGLKLEEPAGALVTGVVEDGPAAASGLEVGDVILRFDGKDVTEMRDLPRMVAETDVGKAVRVVVWRKGESRTLKVTLGLLEEEQPVVKASAEAGAPEAAEAQVLGLTLGPVTPKRREAFGIDESVEGVLITDVDPDGPAAEKGLSPGDVIVEVSLEPVTAPEAVVEKVREAEENGRKSVMLLVHSRGEGRFVAVPLE